MELPPFDLAEQVCLINIEGVSDFTSKTLKPKSEIEIYGPENNFETFTNKLYEESASMVTLNLNDGLEAVSFTIEQQLSAFWNNLLEKIIITLSIHLQLSSLQDWCETSLKPERAEVLKALRDEKNAEAKQFVEAIAVMSVLSQATCKMPEFLQIDLNLNDAKSRDKYMELFVDTVKAFSKRYSENTNGNGMVAVLSSDEKPLKRSRRAVADVNIYRLTFFSYLPKPIRTEINTSFYNISFRRIQTAILTWLNRIQKTIQ